MQNYICNVLGTLGVYLLTNKRIFIFNMYSNYNIETLRSRMTSSKIDLVSRKAKRLYQMRVLLNTTRRLCREYEDVMADFCGVKATIETAPRGQIG